MELSSLKIDFILTNSVDPGETRHLIKDLTVSRRTCNNNQYPELILEMLSDFLLQIMIQRSPLIHKLLRTIEKRHKLYFFQGGRRRPDWKTGSTHCQETFCQRNYKWNNISYCQSV